MAALKAPALMVLTVAALTLAAALMALKPPAPSPRRCFTPPLPVLVAAVLAQSCPAILAAAAVLRFAAIRS